MSRGLGDVYKRQGVADAAIVCSGTATLETAMLKCPMIVCYTLSTLTWIVAQMLSKVEHFSLVNLIGEETIVDEFLQKEMLPKNLSDGINKLLKNENHDAIIKKYNQLIEKLKTKDNVYDSAAKYIYD